MKKGRKREYRYFSCDFETTVYEGQINTEVWASACVEFGSEDVTILHSIDETFDYFKSLNSNIVAYYHNLKFDGHFWLYYLKSVLNMPEAVERYSEEWDDFTFLKDEKMPNNTFKYVISDMGQWYKIVIKVKGYYIELRDSLKLLPFSVKQIGQGFGTKHKKLDMEYKGVRYAGCFITDQEREYIANDVLVVKEALEIMFSKGLDRLTIGSCCLSEFKKIFMLSRGKEAYNYYMPDLTKMELDKNKYGYENVDAYVRRSYKGGWCYLVKGKEGLHKKGVTADVNSLYPSMMHSESGNRYPVGRPTFWQGNKIPYEAYRNNRYFFVRVKTRFYLKKGKLPFIQIKGDYKYKSNECLESSDVSSKSHPEPSPYYVDIYGNVCDTRVTMTLTCTDYKLFLEHYDVVDFEILDGCFFDTAIGLFDEYINKYRKMKIEAPTKAIRQISKLMLNNLYGKTAASNISNFKIAMLKDNDIITFASVHDESKQAGYIAIGSAITSYARNFTIRAAQQNFYGANKKGFIYADTDSIHCDLKPEELKGIKVHDKNFCCWKLEAYWDKATFTRQKTYIEHVTHEDGEPLEEPYNNIKCAGMPESCKKLLNMSLEGIDYAEGLNAEALEFISKERTYKDFTFGLIVPGKLMPKRIPGGIVLTDTTFEMR